MDEQSDTQCPICAYQYSTPDKLPKLLPCYHTICSPCVDKIIATTHLNSDSNFKCPICRQGASVPKNGVQGFFDNYFRCAPQQEKTCDKCGAGDNCNLEYCKECKSLLCDSCQKNHHHQIKSKDEKSDEDEDEDDCKDKSPSHSGFSRDNSVRRANLGNHGKTFKCNNFESIRKIIPEDTNECWALTNQPYVTRLSRIGKETFRKIIDTLNTILHDIARRQVDGSLVLAFANGDILLLNGMDLRYVTNTGDVPTALFAFQDGRLLIATRPHSGSIRLNNSELLITDQTMTKITPLDVNVDIQEVSSITVDEKNEQIALCEPLKKVVCFFRFVKLKHPKVKKYRGNSNLLPMENTKEYLNILGNSLFQPRSVESDQNGSFYVLDEGTNLIHVLNEEATLQSFLRIDTTEIISCFNLDTDGNYWVGGESGGIRFISITEGHSFSDEGQPIYDFEILDETGDSDNQESVWQPGVSGFHRSRSSDSEELSGTGDLNAFESSLSLDEYPQI